MSFIYTRAQLKQRINAGIHGKIGMLLDANETCNEAVRQFTTAIDSRSSRRRATLFPDLFQDINEYSCPADVDAYKLIDIPAQAKRQDGEFFLIPSSDFKTTFGSSSRDRDFRVCRGSGALAIDDYNGLRTLLIDSAVESNGFTVSELDDFESGGGTWQLFGDAEFLGNDDGDFIKGNGSLTFDINNAGNTTAGLFNDELDAFDLSDYIGGQSSFFIWAKIASTVGITNYKLRFGADANDYFELTTTSQANGIAFVNGWNLLRFPIDMSVATETGTLADETNVTYVSVFMTKLGSKISETDYKLDWLVVKKGIIHDIEYYSKYGWQTSAGVYKENSTTDAGADTDLIVADRDEYDLIVMKGTEIAAREVREYDVADNTMARFDAKAKEYQMRNPSEAKIMTNGYYNY